MKALKVPEKKHGVNRLLRAYMDIFPSMHTWGRVISRIATARDEGTVRWLAEWRQFEATALFGWLARI
jgi:hypothetical protein